ncbi:MAG: energy-coupling factor transporter transmembrane component T [Candidatus Fimenecus sp.]
MQPDRTFFYRLRTDTLLICMLSVTVTAALRIHPVSGLLSAVTAVLSYVVYGKGRELRSLLRFCAPMGGMLILFNLLFNRNGVTALFYIGDAAVTLEAVLYAVCSALVFTSTVLWFSFYCLFLDCDRVYAFLARFSRGLGLVVSLSLSLVPKTMEKYNQMRTENTVNSDKAHRFTGLILRLSALFSWVFDDAFQTALSMKARGALCVQKRQKPKVRWRAADGICILLALSAIVACFSPPLKTAIYPRFAGAQYVDGAVWYLPLLLLYAVPCVCKLWEVFKWKFLLQRI